MTAFTKSGTKFGLPALAVLAGVALVVPGAMAQYTGPNAYIATINDPVGPVPDPGHVPFTLPKDIKWTGTPGRQETAILWGDPAKGDPMKAKIPAGRFGRTTEVADLILFLASSASDMICGQTILLDGGFTAQ